MNVRPLRDRVLVKRIEAQEQRIGGIIVPDTATEKPQQAAVIAVGNGASTTMERRFRSTSRWATTCSSESTRVQRSSWMAKSI